MLTSDRALGDYSISVGTSQALIKVVDPNRANSRSATFEPYEHLAINILTLIRNAQSSLGSQDQNTLMPTHIAKFVMDDIQTISNVCKDAKVPLMIYVAHYDKLQKHYPIANLRVPTTTKQLFAKDYQDSVVKLLIEHIGEGINDGTIVGTKFKIGDVSALEVKSKTLLMTSYAVDLLEMQPEALLQSYTGEIIPKWEFWKLYNKNSRLKEYDFGRIPFNKLFIQLFGDSKTFHGRGYKELERILEIAEKRDWNQNTTKSRIKLSLEQAELWNDDYAKVVF